MTHFTTSGMTAFCAPEDNYETRFWCGYLIYYGIQLNFNVFSLCSSIPGNRGRYFRFSGDGCGRGIIVTFLRSVSFSISQTNVQAKDASYLSSRFQNAAAAPGSAYGSNHRTAS